MIDISYFNFQLAGKYLTNEFAKISGNDGSFPDGSHLVESDSPADFSSGFLVFTSRILDIGAACTYQMRWLAGFI